jgi:RND family efflux transporter MFP subunit
LYLALAILAVVLAWFTWTDESGNGSVALNDSFDRSIRMAAAEMQQMETRDTLIAFVEPARDIEVNTQIDGLLVSVNYDIGDTVDSGQVMAALEDTQHRLDLTKARVRHDRVRSELDRMRALANKSLISVAELELAELAGREAAVELQQAEYNLKLTAVRAPFTGVIVTRWARFGQWVEEGTALFRLVEPGRPQARVFWDANFCHDWRVGDTLWYLHTDGGLEPALISRASPLADPVSGTREFVVHFANDLVISSTSIRLVHKQRHGLRLVIPRDALPESMRLRPGSVGTVLVQSAGETRTMAVVVGMVTDQWVEIVKGLEKGDTVQLRVHRGEPIP